MNDRIKEAFGQIFAEDTLKNSTKEYVLSEMSHKMNQQKRRLCRSYRYLLPAAACFLLVMIGYGGVRFYLTPVSVISIDINPSVEWSINRFDKVISVENYNEDGAKLSAGLDVTWKDYSEALALLMKNPVVEDYLAQDEYLSITVVGNDSARNDRMMETVRSCTSGISNTHCGSADYSELEEAHEAGLSCGKYKAYLLLKALDPDVTTGEIADMTMREIHRLIETLSENDAAETDGTAFSENSCHNHMNHSENTFGNSSSGKKQHRN